MRKIKPFRSRSFSHILVIVLVLMTFSSYSQTLTNLPLLQRKRSETDLSNLPSTISNAALNTFAAPALAVGASTDPRPTDELTRWQEAARFARDHQEVFSKLLEMYSNFGEIIIIDWNSGEPNLRTLAYAVLSQQNQTTLNQYYADNRITDGTIKTAIESEINALRTAIKKISSPTITVFATGNIRSIATNKTPEPTTTGTGTLGATYASSKHVFSAQFSVASTLDTTKSGFGSYLLAPLNGKSLKSAAIEWYPKLNWSNNSWLHLYGNFASSLWEVQKDTIYKNISTIGIGVLYHHRIFEGLIAETTVGLDGEIGIVGRWLDGDIRHLLNDEANTAKYLKAFPTKKSFFTGLEAGLTLNFGQVVGALQVFYFFSKKDEPIDGLTKLQISVGLSVRGDIIRGFLDGRN